MLRPGTQSDYIDRRINLPTTKSHADIVRDLEPKIKAQAFFSARVAEAHILERLRSVTDAYSRGEMGLGEARNTLKDFLWAKGNDPHLAGLRNLAGTARLNLILKQNAAMTHAAAEWKRMHDPDAMRVFPYVRYHARNDSKTRSAHEHLDGKIFHKDDPFLKTHTPPWEFNCRCYLEEITEKEAQRYSGMIQTPTPADKVTVDSKSGFVFDPEHAFEEFDMASIKDLEFRRKTYAGMADLAKKTDTETTFLAAPATPVSTLSAPENLDEIKQALTQVKAAVDSKAEGEPYTFPEITCSLGYIAKERFDAIGMLPEENVEVIFESPGKSDYGMKHWRKHHIDDWKRPDAVEYLLRLMSATLWNPKAMMSNTHSKNGKRLQITSPDKKIIANLWFKGDKWVYSIQDTWDISESQNPMFQK